MASSARVDSLRKQYDENPRRYFAALANEYRKSGDLEQAIALCRAHLPQQPNHISGHIVFGQALFEAGQLDESRTVFETALGLDPENLIALRHLGDIANAGGDPRAARAWYERILNADPRNEEIQSLLDALPADALSADAVAAEAAPEQPAAGDAMADRAAQLDASDADDVRAPSLIDVPVIPEPAPEAAAEAAAAAAAEPAPAIETSSPLEFGVEQTPNFGDETTDAAPDSPSALPGAAASHGYDPGFGSGDATPASRHGGDSFAHASAPSEAERDTPALEEAASEPEGFAPTAYGAMEDALDDRLAPPPPSAEPFLGHGQELFGSPDDFARGAEPATSDLGVEHMEFRPPEPEPAQDDDELVAEAAAAAAAAAADSASPEAFVTETMAELYLQQGFHDEALNVYRQLLANNPHDRSLRDRVRQLEAGSDASMGAVAATSAAAPRRGRTARSFFGALALRRAPAREPMGEPVAASAPEPTYESVYEPAPSAADASLAFDAPEAVEAPPADEAPQVVEAAPPHEPPPELEASAPAAPEGPLADDLAGPAHTSEPLAFEGATASGVLGHHAPEVSEADLAAGAPVAATPQVEPGEEAEVYHPPLGDEPEDAPTDEYEEREGPMQAPPDLPYLDTGETYETPATRSSLPATLDSAFGGEPEPSAADYARSEIDGGSLDRLFGGSAVAPDDDVAATSLASAFAVGDEASPPGKPTRPADEELSLDHVFRAPLRAAKTPSASVTPSSPAPQTVPQSAPAGRGAPGGSFSFDQFFAEVGGASAPPEATSADPGDVAASDIEQFNAWLEGLKKK